MSEPLSADAVAAIGRATSYWQHVRCRCGWSRSVQLNAKPATIRRGFRAIGDHFAEHRERADDQRRLPAAADRYEGRDWSMFPSLTEGQK